jgi:hypothetical protein
MRVVLGTYSLVASGGTETYVMTVARELQRLGHEAIVGCEEFGPMAEFMERNGIDVARGHAELPDTCDCVLAHDAIMTTVLAERYRGTRLVYCAHSPVHDVQLPPLVPSVVSAIVVLSGLTAARIRALALDVPIVRLRQPIDTERFIASPIRQRPRSAIAVSNYLGQARFEALVRAWEAAGVQCRHVGAEQLLFDVVPAIASADIVVGKARAVLEGMSCGRAVYIYDEFGGDGWVTPENYPALEANNFAGTSTSPVRPSPDDIGQYRDEMGWLNRELITINHDARKHAAALVEVLRGDPPSSSAPATPMTEISRLIRASWQSERRAMNAERERHQFHTRALAAEQTAEEASERAAAAAAAGEAAEAAARAAEAAAEAAEQRALTAESHAAATSQRAASLEQELRGANGVLDSRRVRAGLAVGRTLDRIRWRR